MTKEEIIEMPEYLNAAYEGDDLYTGDQVRELMKLVAEKAIKEALAQPEQYPQIAINPEIVGYVAPQRKPLLDEKIEEIAEGYLVDYRIPAGCAWNFARDIEAAHGIKE